MNARSKSFASSRLRGATTERESWGAERSATGLWIQWRGSSKPAWRGFP